MFEGSRLKVERAKKHINDLNVEFATYAARVPWVFSIERDEDPQRCTVVARNREPLPAHLTLIVGDAIHNLRSALDYLACDIVRNADNTADLSETYFPFCKGATPNDLKSRLAQTKIDKASKKVVDVFHSMKLTPGGDLYAIHALDIEDKHRTLLGVGSAGFAPNVISSAITLINVGIGSLGDGQKVMIFPKPESFNFGDQLAASIYIRFARGLPFEREPTIKKLLDLTKVVNSVVDAIELASK